MSNRARITFRTSKKIRLLKEHVKNGDIDAFKRRWTRNPVTTMLRIELYGKPIYDSQGERFVSFFNYALLHNQYDIANWLVNVIGIGPCSLIPYRKFIKYAKIDPFPKYSFMRLMCVNNSNQKEVRWFVEYGNWVTVSNDFMKKVRLPRLNAVKEELLKILPEELVYIIMEFDTDFATYYQGTHEPWLSGK